MKLRRLETTYAVILAIIFGLIVVHAPLSVYFGSHFPHFALLIKSWKEILMLVALAIVCIIISRRRLWRDLSQDWLLRLIAVFVVLHIVLLPFHFQGIKVAAAGLEIDLRYVVYFVLVYVLIKIAPWWRARMLVVGTCGAAVVVVFGTLQLFLPRDILSHIGYSKATIAPYLTVDDNPKYIRINSTLRGPNPLGAYAGMVLVLIASYVARAKLRAKNPWWLVLGGIMMVCGVVTLWISYSRSGVIGTIAALMVVAAVVFGRRVWRYKAWLGAAVIVVIGLTGWYLSAHSLFVDNVILHNNPTTGPAKTSDSGHLSSLRYGVKNLAHQPLGDGIGSTGSASLLGNQPGIIENQYLFIAHETGWLGLGVFVAIFVMILQRLWRRRHDWLALGVFASGIGLAIIGLLLPIWADDTVSIVWWGLAATALGTEYGRAKSNQKAA